MTTKSRVIYSTGIIIAQLLIFTGIALVVTQVFQTVLHNLVKKQIVLKEGADVFKSWQNPSPPVYMQYYFFNVTNAQAVMQGGKPTVEEIGPYTYREYRPRENVTFLENGTKVSALSPKTFVFRRDMSSGDPEVDLITTVNIPAVAVMEQVKSSIILSSIISFGMQSIGVEMFMTRTVNELLPLLTRLRAFKPEVEEYFGLMYKKNGTSDDQFVFHTGMQDYKDFGKIESWNGERITRIKHLVNTVLHGAPVVVSFPHFYQADQKYVDAIEGLSPNKDDHETYLDINPKPTAKEDTAYTQVSDKPEESCENNSNIQLKTYTST
ncbi:UNVERIFIED_CONTAM: hypothetical protein FKN15_008713 [Acipenser sinensis]